MSGIAGAIDANAPALIGKMTGALRHRGPHSEGHRLKPNISLGATGLKAFHPIYETQSVCVLLDGQIRNHAKLRERLGTKGHLFTTHTEAEVLAHLYEEEGENLVQHLHGAYAFAILDGSRLLLARDRLGLKPLYYAYVPQSDLFLFASEIKAILQHPEIAPSLDMQAFADSLVLGHPVGNLTFFSGVKLVRPGHLIVVSFSGEVHIDERLFCAPSFTREEGLNFNEAHDILGRTLEDVATEYLDSEGPIAVTLSGGLDSTLLALLAGKQKAESILTFTVADDDRNPDLAQAAAVAQLIGSKHFRVTMSFDDYLKTLPGCIEAMEVPSTGYSAPFYFLCREVAAKATICLDGEGADELFGGYTDYLNWQSRIRFIERQLRLLERLGYSPSDSAMRIIGRICSTMNLEQHLQTIFELNLGDRLERFRADPVDRCAMAANLDIRLPYLDDRVVELAARLPAQFLVRVDLGIEKYILRRLLIERGGTAFLDVVLRRKIGAPGAGASSLERFDKLCDTVLPEDYLSAHELGFCFGSKRHLFMFELFVEVFMRHRGESREVGSTLHLLSARAGRNVSSS